MVDYNLSAQDRADLRRARNKISGGIALAGLGVAAPLAYYLKVVKSAEVLGSDTLQPSPFAEHLINHPAIPAIAALICLTWAGFIIVNALRQERLVTKRIEATATTRR